MATLKKVQNKILIEFLGSKSVFVIIVLWLYCVPLIYVTFLFGTMEKDLVLEW